MNSASRIDQASTTITVRRFVRTSERYRARLIAMRASFAAKHSTSGGSAESAFQASTLIRWSKFSDIGLPEDGFKLAGGRVKLAPVLAERHPAVHWVLGLVVERPRHPKVKAVLGQAAIVGRIGVGVRAGVVGGLDAQHPPWRKHAMALHHEPHPQLGLDVLEHVYGADLLSRGVLERPGHLLQVPDLHTQLA